MALMLELVCPLDALLPWYPVELEGKVSLGTLKLTGETSSFVGNIFF